MAQRDRDHPYRHDEYDERPSSERGQWSERRSRPGEQAERHPSDFEWPSNERDRRAGQHGRYSERSSEYDEGRQSAMQRDYRREPYGGYERGAEYAGARRREYGDDGAYPQGGREGTYGGRAPYGAQWPYGTRGGQGDQGSYGGQGPYGGNYGWASQVGAQGRMRRGPKGYTRSDERLKEDIAERLMYAWDVEASDVSLEVQNGKVVLEGTVPERRMKHAIEDIVDNCPGVQDIDNRVRVARGDGMAAEARGRGSSSDGRNE